MKFIGILFFLLAGCATTKQSATSDFSELAFPTEISAVIHASKTYRPLSQTEDVEYMGAIIRDINGKFIYSVANNRRGGDQIKINIKLKRGWKVIAFWHTHGKPSGYREYFSDTDTELVNKTGKPLYLATPTGRLKVFYPGDPTLNRLMSQQLQLPKHSGYAEGREVTFLRY